MKKALIAVTRELACAILRRRPRGEQHRLRPAEHRVIQEPGFHALMAWGALAFQLEHVPAM